MSENDDDAYFDEESEQEYAALTPQEVVQVAHGDGLSGGDSPLVTVNLPIATPVAVPRVDLTPEQEAYLLALYNDGALREALNNLVRVTGKSDARDESTEASVSVNEEIETLLKFATLVKAKKLNQIRGLEEVASRNNFTQELIKLMKDIETADEVDPGTVLKADSKLAKALLGDVSPVSGFAAQMESLQEQASVASPPPPPHRHQSCQRQRQSWILIT